MMARTKNNEKLAMAYRIILKSITRTNTISRVLDMTFGDDRVVHFILYYHYYNVMSNRLFNSGHFHR